MTSNETTNIKAALLHANLSDANYPEPNTAPH